MLESLKQSGKDLGQSINRAWNSTAKGWHELMDRSSNALTRFTGAKKDNVEAGGGLEGSPQWGLLAGEIEETDSEVLVRMEVPGMSKDDCSISIEGNQLCIKGEKVSETESITSTYHMTERAYGAFERYIPLPRYADFDKAQASCRNGVLTVRMPKVPSMVPKAIRIN